jgi:MinD-like ATPase involved in chromosome partitioning or flagellar assembly
MNANGNGHGNGFYSRWWSALRKRSDQADQDAAAYRRLALQLHLDLSGSNGRRSALFVTANSSAICAQGSVEVASCLAGQVCRPVLLMDACPENPETSRILQSNGSRGFTDFLTDPKLRLDELVLPTTCENVSFLPAGAIFNRSGAAPPQSVKTVLNTVEAKYDYVLLSGGSVLHDPTTLALAPHVGCVLLLVIENQTLMEDLDAAQDVLALCNARKVGLVFTKQVRNELRPI